MRVGVACVVLSGCFQTVDRPSCDEHAVDVADDEPTPEGTAADLLANVVGGGSADGVLAPDDAVVPVTWSVARRPGSAQWIESEETTVTTRSDKIGFGKLTLAIAVFCDDRLEAPVTAAITTDGGEVDVSVDTVVASLPDVLSEGWWLLGIGAFGDAVFPELPDADPADFTDKQSFVELTGLGSSDTPVTGRAGWEGTLTTETSVSSHAHTAVTF